MCTFIIQVDMTNIIGPKGWFQRWNWSEPFQNGGCFLITAVLYNTDRNSNQKLGLNWTKFCRHVFGSKISAQWFVIFGQNSLQRFKMAAILNIYLT